MSDKFEVRFLTPDEHPLWDEFVNRSPQGSIFVKSFWLNIVGENYRIVGCFRNDLLVGGIAFDTQKRSGFHLVKNSILTQYMGILYEHNAHLNRIRQASQEKEILTRIIAFLEKRYDRIAITHHPNVVDIRPFIWNAFTAEIRYSYWIDITDLDRVFKDIDKKKRNLIRKCEKENIRISISDDPISFHQLHARTFERQGQKCPVPQQLTCRIYEQLASISKCRLYFAENTDECALSAAFVITDDKRAYYLMGATNPDFRVHGSSNLLLWKVMQDLSQNGVEVFDFYGANTDSIAWFKRGFGGHLNPYFRVRKCVSPTLFFLEKATEVLSFFRS